MRAGDRAWNGAWSDERAMRNNLVVLINPNKLHPGIPPIALDILTTSLEQADFNVEVVDLTFQRDRWREVLGDYFKDRSPLLVGITVRNTDTIYPQEQRVFLPEHKEIIDEVRRLTAAPLVAGGVGFSSMPFALVEYFGLDYGVKGPGELVISGLASALRRGEPATAVPGLIINTAAGAEQVPWAPGLPATGLRRRAPKEVPVVNGETPYLRRSGSTFKVDNLRYYELGGLGNVLTKNGCPFRCTHCVEPDAKGDRFSRREVGSVVAELEALAGQGVLDVHSTDSEVNLSFVHIKDILRELVERKRTRSDSPLHRLRLWLYCQPAPFDEEFASLLAEAGCKGINFGSDHTCKSMIEGWKITESDRTYYSYQNIQAANGLALEHGMLVMHDILLGMPGETIETVYQCLDETLALNATVIGYTLGIRVFPYSPLGIRFAAESGGERAIRGLQSNTATAPIVLTPLEACRSAAEYERQFMFEPSGQFRPVYFFSPELPEDEATLSSPSGRWTRTLELMRDHVPEREHTRVMLPTVPGLSKDDNNYADNPFLMLQARLGYKGAFWSRWRQRDQIMAEASQGDLALSPSGRAQQPSIA